MIKKELDDIEKAGLTEEEEQKIFSYGFDRGYEQGYDEGLLVGSNKRSEEDFKKGFFAAVKRHFNDFYDFKNTIDCAEEFIKKFNEKFKGFSIYQARIGVNPASFTPTAFFVTDVPEDMEDDLCDLKRDVEFEFMKMNPGHPVCVWSVQGPVVDEKAIMMDFPLARRMA